MAWVLGVSAFYHDAAAALVNDGEIVAAAQEERFSRVKNDPRFPERAINYCLGQAFIEPDELGAVVYYDNPILTLDRVVESALAVAPRGRDQFVAAAQAQLGPKAAFVDELEMCLGDVPPVLMTEHHASHAASAFYPSPFDRAAILTIDGVGEWATCTIGVGEGTEIELLREIRYPHSLGLLYSAFTSFCGFAVNSGEYKLMGLAPYGRPVFADVIRDELIDVRPDGSFRLNTAAFGYLDSPRMTGARFEELFDGPPRHPEAPITRREMDLAASVQRVTEEIVLGLARTAVDLTGSSHLTMAGGVALNCVANGRAWRELGLDGLFVQPAAGDAGGALGAALLTAHQRFGATRPRGRRDGQHASLLGPEFSADDVHAVLDRYDVVGERIVDDGARAVRIAEAIDDGKIVGLFSHRMEFGPRALGARSIIGDARRPEMQRHINLAVKFREGFRPFAPAVLAERAADYFDLEGDSPYMLLVAPIKADRRRSDSQNGGQVGDGQEGDDLMAVLDRVRSDIPAVTHVDHSARVQTVGPDDHPELRRILEAFEERTGCSVVVNTSFNVRDEPIVCTPLDAYRCFTGTGIDLLVLGDTLVWSDSTNPSPAVEARPPQRQAGSAQPSAAIAATIFDEVLTPLARADRETSRIERFPLGADPAVTSYFTERAGAPEVAHAHPLQLEGGGRDLVDAIAGHWEAIGRDDLVELAPRLRVLADELREEAAEQSEFVDILCYTLF